MSETEALEGLRRSEEKLRAYGAEHGLVLREESPWPGYVPAAQQPGPVKHAVWSLAGVLPGGAIGRLRHQAIFGSTFGMDVAGQHTLMICRIPESVGYVPYLGCRPDTIGGAMYAWDNDNRPKQSQVFESVELERRYKVEVAAGQAQNWIYQLFTPTFIDWLAHSTPVDFGFKLDLGVFHCETPNWRGQEGSTSGEVEPALLDVLLENGSRVASRIRDEVLEEAQLIGEPGVVDSAEAYAKFATAPKHGRIIKSILWLARVGAEDDGTAKYATERGMEPESPAQFHARHIGLAMPGAATAVATGPLPQGGREGSVAWLQFSSIVDMEQEYVAVAVGTDARLPSVWIDPEDVGAPGIGAELPAAAEAAMTAGYGLATAHRSACVYMRTEGTTPGSEIDRFAGEAQRIIALLEGSPQSP
ncbi:MAG: hypothetical protein KDB58_04080 [Solirubrobacterales bacterium]|nr:hypothetical protein [Solirubrobacterales bacterium]MCB8971028.1 hypothetical protein [Thermoleophilales bacterium]MCO5326078.1 hypothetical protein [Solirubrobacterales bacterium]